MLLDQRNAIIWGGGGAIGGAVELEVVDALDERAVTDHAARVAAEFGSLDIAFDLISVQDVQGTPMVEMTLEDYERPVTVALRSFFITSKAVAPHMIRQRSGVILTFGGDGGDQPIRHYSIGGFQTSLHTVDAMRRQLAAELGEFGIRVNTIHTGGIVETLPKDFPDGQVVAEMLVEPTMLGRTATLAEIGGVAVFLASDAAASITGASLNITAGATAD